MRFLKLRSAGFSLVEIIIVVAIVATLATVGSLNYARSQRLTMLNATAERIESVLNLARQRSIGQEQGLEWGVRFENPSSGAGFYEIYRGAIYNSSNVTEKFFLSSPVVFSHPNVGNAVDIKFLRRTGALDATQNQDVIIRLPLENRTKTIRIYTTGLIEVL